MNDISLLRWQLFIFDEKRRKALPDLICDIDTVFIGIVDGFSRFFRAVIRQRDS